MSTTYSSLPVRPTRIARPGGRGDFGRRPAVDAAVSPVGPATRPSAPPSRLTQSVRLTRRGQVLMVGVLLALVLATWSWLGSPTAASSHAHHPSAHSIVVRPGQTLWDIAGEIAPDKDPRTVIAEIEDLNAISDPGDLVAGQPLYVPTYR
jgi:nucleoid-associated protein YgaU